MDKILTAFDAWFHDLKKYGDIPAKGTIAGALIVLEKLKEQVSFEITDYTAKGGAQIMGVSGQAVRKLLADHNETRPFLSEGGRTNRGLRGDIESLLQVLRSSGFGDLKKSNRKKTATELQSYLVERIKDFHGRKRLTFVFNAEETAQQVVQHILELAKERGAHGQVAQYLVGAKLALRFPDLTIRNDSYSTADSQTGEAGDFKIRDTAFHVTVSPTLGHYDRCKANLEQGMRVYLLVPSAVVLAARQNVTNQLDDKRVSVCAIEEFVGQNIDELAEFSRIQFVDTLHQLLETYNRRVDEADSDKSLLVEIPYNLAPLTE